MRKGVGGHGLTAVPELLDSLRKRPCRGWGGASSSGGGWLQSQCCSRSQAVAHGGMVHGAS